MTNLRNYWRTEQTPSIQILNVFSIPAPTLLDKQVWYSEYSINVKFIGFFSIMVYVTPVYTAGYWIPNTLEYLKF